jgi:hypothetical protein
VTDSLFGSLLIPQAGALSLVLSRLFLNDFTKGVEGQGPFRKMDYGSPEVNSRGQLKGLITSLTGVEVQEGSSVSEGN